MTNLTSTNDLQIRAQEALAGATETLATFGYVLLIGFGVFLLLYLWFHRD